jgi:hypothetical protein
MQEISNLLRHRLAARPQPQEHPDPDTLTAFAEQALSAAERGQVIQHLADCGHCREVVALSLPQLEVQPVAVAAASKRPLFWTLAIRWGSVAAALVIAISLGVLRPWEHAGPVPQSVAQKDAASQEPTSAAQPIAPMATSAPSPAKPGSAEADAKAAAKRRAEAEVATSQPAARASGIPGIVGGSTATVIANEERRPRSVATHADLRVGSGGPSQEFVNSNTLSNLANNNTVLDKELPVAPAPRVAGSQPALRRGPPVTSESIIVSTMNVPVDSAKAEEAAVPPPAMGGNTFNDSKTAFVKKMIVTAKDKVTAVGKVRPSTATNSFSTSFSPSFSSSSGGARLGAGDAGSAGSQKMADQFYWKISPDGKLFKSDDLSQWHEAYPQAQELKLNVVVKNGSDIWAGGNRLTLIHSWDGGETWQKLAVAQPGTGDINDIKIGDSDNDVQVKTTNGQTFVSHDKGKTWVPLKQETPTEAPK